MNLTEAVLEHLSSMGFETQEMEGLGYAFFHEDGGLLYMPDEKDNSFLRICIPQIFDVTDENKDAVLEAIHDTALLLKYSKLGIMYGTVWAIYEHHITSTENLTEEIEHIIMVLKATAMVFMKKITGEDDDFEE